MICPKCGYETIYFGETLNPCIACGYMNDIEFYGEASSEYVTIEAFIKEG